MRMKLLSVAKYIRDFLSKKFSKPDPIKKGEDDSLKRLANHFYNEGFGFWLDPFDSYRKASISRAGPALF